MTEDHSVVQNYLPQKRACAPSPADDDISVFTNESHQSVQVKEGLTFTLHNSFMQVSKVHNEECIECTIIMSRKSNFVRGMAYNFKDLTDIQETISNTMKS